jgi:catechol 2,3-dioxygenase-like lactoylglutathione lyase family enzyme
MTITDIRIVGVDVTDQDAALAFYTETLGFTIQMDGDTPAGRWLVVAPPDASTSLALIANQAAAGHDTGIRFATPDAAATRNDLAARGVTVGELLIWDGAPPMFSFEDPDANRFYVVQDWS